MAPDSQWSQTTRHHQLPIGIDPLRINNEERLYTTLIYDIHIYCRVGQQKEPTYAPLPLSGIVKLLPQHKEVDDIRHVVVSAKAHAVRHRKET